MEKVLVTGATGFIGNYVVRELLSRGCAVVATSRDAVRAPQSDWFNAVKYIPFNFHDFAEQTDYFRFFDQPTRVIHLAWEGLPNYTDPVHTTVNLPLQIAFLNNLIRHGLRRLTVTGTCFEYGMREGRLSEEMTPAPANAYAAAKNRLREQLADSTTAYEVQLNWVRLFYMYGPGQNPKSLFSQLQRAIDNHDTVFNMSGGEQVRDYLPVQQVAACIAGIALQNKSAGIINCCSGEPVTVKEMVARYLEQHQGSIPLNLGYYPYTDYEPMAFWGDNNKLKQLLKDE